MWVVPLVVLDEALLTQEQAVNKDKKGTKMRFKM